jgi:hypothetical protein
MGIKTCGHSRNPELAMDPVNTQLSYTSHRLPSHLCLGLSSGLFLHIFQPKFHTVFKSKKVWSYVTTLTWVFKVWCLVQQMELLCFCPRPVSHSIQFHDPTNIMPSQSSVQFSKPFHPHTKHTSVLWQESIKYTTNSTNAVPYHNFRSRYRHIETSSSKLLQQFKAPLCHLFVRQLFHVACRRSPNPTA